MHLRFAMKRAIDWTFAAVMLLATLRVAAMVLLGTSPSWIARSRHGEQAYGVLLVVAHAGLRAWPVLFSSIVVVSAAWLWQRWTARRRVAG